MQLNLRKKPETAPTITDLIESAGPRRQAFVQATDSLRDLMQQDMKLTQRTAELEARQPELAATASHAEQHVQSVQARHVRGLALDEELQVATIARDAAITERDRARNELQALHRGDREIKREIETARKALADARWHLLGDVADQLATELQADPAIRAKLDLIDACARGMRDPALHVPGRFDFGDFVTRTFDEPDDDVRARLLAQVNAAVPLFTVPAA